MVIIVKGTIGNLNNVLRHTENNRSKENDRKRKFIQDDIQLTFPIHLNGIQAHHEHVLKAFTQGEHDDITIDWEFSDQTEALLARMIARSSMVILWENKWRISKEEIYQQKITNERELLIAIVLGISQRWIETNHVHLEWKNGLWMRLSFGVDPERMDELVFTKDQRNESLDAFFLALQPPVTNLRLNHYVSDKMQSNLSPFQTQNVEWMLKREGHYADHQGFVLPFASVYQKPPLLHTQINGLIINQANDRIVTDQEQLERLQRISYRGGILADEMGLGKTVCATLIITPNMIVSQWISEFKKHAPSLRYYIYKGRNKGDTIDTKGLAKYDVVLSDYETLKTEINHSIPSPNRPRRKAVKYGYSQSPLVTTFWFRCVLDEAQMIESNTSKITKMAKRIPHYYSWAVSGTPMKKNYTDLYTLYDFLKLEKTLTPTVFSQFVKKRAFMEFAKETIRRNTKRYLDSQVQIPPQYRHVVLVPFSTIEQHYYQDLWRQCRQEIDLDWLDRLDWVCPTDQIDRYNSALSRQRSWLLALRQSCIHPSVIINPSYRLIKTNSKIQLLSEVLVDMGRDAQDTLDDHQYAFYKSSLRLAGMHEVLELFESAVEIYTSALVPVLSLEQAHGKAVQRVENMRDEGNENNLSSLKNKHQRWLLLLHQFYFYAAGVSHVLKREAEEEAYYGQADALREKMLRKSVDRVESAIEEVNKSVQKGLNMKQHEAGSRHLNINLALLGDNGKHTKNVIENVNKIGIVLDRQLKRMNDLKNKALPILTKSLAEKKEKDAPTGDEYAVSLSEQELCQIYLDAYNELLKDRNFIVKGTTSSQSDQERENDKFMSEEAKLVKKTETEFRSQITSLAGFRIESLKDTEQHLRILKGSSNLSDYVRDLQNESVWIRELLLSQEDLLECLDNDAHNF
ncbi:hypothetical protein G6F56_006657 [Rhizopus delemar]|nr:hypothetical protein G6F56_006657 [Rhizopus delemar]